LRTLRNAPGYQFILVEQRRLSNTAGSSDVQCHERRLAGLQRRPEDLDLFFASDKTLAAGRRESIANPRTVGRRHLEIVAGGGNRRDQPVASLGNRLDVLRIPLVVAECSTQVGDRAGQSCLGDEPALPHGLDDLVPRDHAVLPAGQKDQ
jgi:hypothetical protein